jgi:hypothetical protein
MLRPMPTTRPRPTALLVLAGMLRASTALAQPAPEPGPPPPPEPEAKPTPTPPANDKETDDTWQHPAKAADPPLLPPPRRDGPPTSTSGTDLAPAQRPAAPPIVVSDREVDAKQDARLDALDRRVERDEQRARKLEERLRFLKHLTLESFIQPQLLVQSWNAAASPNADTQGVLPPGIGANDTIARPDGTTTNGTFFRVRRARMRTFYETDVMRLFLQIDALPAGGVGPGIGTILRNAEATGIVRWTRDVRTEFTAGLFFTPFRRELQEASLVRPFIERTWFVQNCFPTERDYGARAKTIALDGRLVVDIATVNGQRLGERTFVALPDLNRSKDVIVYATYNVGFLTLGVSGYFGRGQIVDPQALRFKELPRWAVNYQAAVEPHLFRSIGQTRLSAELTFAQNMDTGVIYPFAVPRIPANIADPVPNLDERALYVRFEQDVGRSVVLGYRYDMYTPDAAIDNNARDTHAFLGVWKISPNLRWMNELDWAIDNVHPFGAAPPSKHIVMYSSVLQAMF